MVQFHFLQVFMIFPACLLFTLPQENQKGCWKNYLMAFAVAAMLAVPVSLFVLSVPHGMPVQKAYWIIRPVLAFGLIALIVKISVRQSWGQTVYCGIWAYLTRELAYHFSMVVARYLLPDMWLFDTPYLIAAVVCHILIYSAVYFSIARNLATEGRLCYSRSQFQLAVLLAASVTVIKPITVFVENGSFEFNLFALTECIGSVFVMIALFIQHTTEKRVMLEQELAAQKRLWLENEKQMESAKLNAELLNTKYHDLKHYIAALRAQQSSEQKSLILDELEKSVSAFDSAVHTGYETLDIVLTEKNLSCQHDQIKLTCVADGTLLYNMDAIDLYVMFGNALDNAIECVCGLKDVQRRIISLAIFRVRDMVKIQIENPYDLEPVFQDDIPVTTKADKNSHGFGMKSIHTVAERYGGYVTATAEEGLFTLHILLPVKTVARDKLNESDNQGR